MKNTESVRPLGPEDWSSNQWLSFFKVSRVVPASRDAAMRELISDFKAVAQAAAKSFPEPGTKVQVAKVLRRLCELRAVSLGSSSWQVELMAWLSAQDKFLEQAIGQKWPAAPAQGS